MTEFRQLLRRLEDEKGNRFDEQHNKLRIRKLKQETFHRQALIVKRRQSSSSRFGLQNNYELPMVAKQQGPRMLYLHEALTAQGQQPLPLNKRLKQQLIRQQSIQSWIDQDKVLDEDSDTLLQLPPLSINNQLQLQDELNQFTYELEDKLHQKIRKSQLTRKNSLLEVQNQRNFILGFNDTAKPKVIVQQERRTSIQQPFQFKVIDFNAIEIPNQKQIGHKKQSSLTIKSDLLHSTLHPQYRHYQMLSPKIEMQIQGKQYQKQLVS